MSLLDGIGLIVALLLLLLAVMVVLSARAPGATAAATVTPSPTPRSQPNLARTRAHAAELLSASRQEAEELRRSSTEEIQEQLSALEAEDRLLDERDRLVRDRNHHFNQHRHSYRERREQLDAEEQGLEQEANAIADMLRQRAGLTSEEAVATVLQRLDSELAAEHPSRVESLLTFSGGEDAEQVARNLIVQALQRQDQGHADGAPRAQPLPMEGLDETQREQLVAALTEVANVTATEIGVDPEREQVTLRSQDPVGRELARRVGLEVLERRLQVADVAPLLISTQQTVRRRIVEVGERALWEMEMEGRAELAELVGTLHFRFSYGQNALLHCQETGYLCGVLAAELGLEQPRAREAGMLHDIGKAVDHDVEGSHAIIGGELLRLFGTEGGIVHAVKAHHFDEEPNSDLAMLTICADAISASRTGARRDTLQTYLTRLEQLQTIATRHEGVERAFPLQAGREVRVVLRARSVSDAAVPQLSHEIAREIEAEMQYPGMIKVTVIRETQAMATAPAQLGSHQSSVASAPELTTPLTSARRRRGGRRRGGGKTPTPVSG